jgi:hypothetical protein
VAAAKGEEIAENSGEISRQRLEMTHGNPGNIKSHLPSAFIIIIKEKTAVCASKLCERAKGAFRVERIAAFRDLSLL